MSAITKRKRSANFTQDEKLKLVRLLQEYGKSIITKVTSHDTSTNKEKEDAWEKISVMLNSSCSTTMRTPDTLKKQWQKLKTDAKTYKASTRYANGTGGGPAKSYDDPVLELVVEITGRGSTGIMSVQDCDASFDATSGAEMSVDELETTYDLDTTIDKDQLPNSEIIIINAESDVPIKEEKLVKRHQPTLSTINDNSNSLRKVKFTEECHAVPTDVQVNNLKRRQPTLTPINERTAVITARTSLSNKFAAERLRAEREKADLIVLQKQQMTELHSAKMENEKLKKVLLETLIYKVKNGDKTDSEAVEVIISTME